MWQGAASFLLLLATGYLAILGYIYFNQTNMLYLPRFAADNSGATPADVGLDYQAITLNTEDDVKLDAWYLPVPDERGVILFCHGNAGNITHRLFTLELLYKLGFSVLIFDYRGYGKSQGETSEQGTYRDAEAAWQYLLQQQRYREDEIVIMGRSLGAAIAAELAHRHRPAAVILESSFTSVPDVAAELYPLFPVRWLSHLRYGTLDYLPSITSPLLIVHSRDDEIIPFPHGQRLFEAANSPKQFLELKGGHNDAIYVSGVDYYRRGLNDFFDRYFDRP